MNGAYPYFYADTTVTTNTTVATVSIQIARANAGRKAFYIWNNSTNSVYINFGPTANSSTGLVMIVPTFQSYRMDGPVIWTGPISAIRNAGTGNCYVTELV